MDWFLLRAQYRPREAHRSRSQIVLRRGVEGVFPIAPVGFACNAILRLRVYAGESPIEFVLCPHWATGSVNTRAPADQLRPRGLRHSKNRIVFWRARPAA